MDPLEDRIRRTLGDSSWRLPADPDVLEAIHTGARRRRRRRAALNIATAVVVVGAGAGLSGYVLNLHRTENVAGPAASSTLGPTPQGDRATEGEKHTVAPKMTTKESAGPAATPRKRTAPATGEVPDDFRAISLSAASTRTFWLLGVERDADNRALIARTSDGGKSFKVIGDVGAIGAQGVNAESSKTVSQIRFVDANNGWAYGEGLFSTHDGGRSWQYVSQVSGSVVRLEAAGGKAYALVDDGGRTALWSSPAAADKWQPAQVKLQHPYALAAAKAMVAVTDHDATKTYALISTDRGASFDQRATPCVADLNAGAIFATKDSLWLQCPTGTESEINVSTDTGKTWTQVNASQPLGNTSMQMGPRDPMSALAAAPGEVLPLSKGQAGKPTSVPGLDAPAYVGFTEPDVGYVLDTDGDLFRTDNGGTAWHKLPVR